VEIAQHVQTTNQKLALTSLPTTDFIHSAATSQESVVSAADEQASTQVLGIQDFSVATDSKGAHSNKTFFTNTSTFLPTGPQNAVAYYST